MITTEKSLKNQVSEKILKDLKMINIKYDREKNSTVIFVNDLSLIGVDYVRVDFKNIITGEIHFTTNIYSNMWTTWNGAELITDVLVYSNLGSLLKEFKWDVTENGDDIEKILWYYLLNRKNQYKNSNGLVIGTHDGRNGHWIYPIINNLSKATLVDGSSSQFEKLKMNYCLHNNVKMINSIVTVDGQDVTWYTGGEGYTDTVVKELISDWLTENQISQETKESTSLKNLMDSELFDWVHLDVEGIDDDLILSLEYTPNIIIFESMNLSEERINKLNQWFSEKNYNTITTNGNTIAVKK